MKRAFILILMALTSCKQPAKETTRNETAPASTPSSDDFEKYVALLPKVSLPFDTNCEKCCQHPKLDNENWLISKLSSEGETIVGVIEKTSDRVVILSTLAADNIIPSVRVYNAKGELLGKKIFLTNYCGGEPGFYSTQYFRINPDISLTEIDTTYHMTFDSVTYVNTDTTKVDIERNNYTINDKGEITEQ